MTNIQAVIYDMDGVLINSEPLWQIAETESFVELGMPFKREMCLETVGWRVDEVVKHWTKKFNYSKHTNEFIVGMMLDKLKILIASEGKALEGVYESLEFFKSKNIPMAIATSSPIVIMEQIVETLNVGKYFKYLCSAQHEPNGKPHPAVFLSAASFLQIEPTHCLVIEDSLNGIIAAKAARMNCIAVPEAHNHYKPKFILADKIIYSLKEINETLWQEMNQL